MKTTIKTGADSGAAKRRKRNRPEDAEAIGDFAHAHVQLQDDLCLLAAVEAGRALRSRAILRGARKTLAETSPSDPRLARAEDGYELVLLRHQEFVLQLSHYLRMLRVADDRTARLLGAAKG